MKTLEYQYALQRGATFLVVAAFSLVLLASITGSLLSNGSLTNGDLIGFLHKFSGHGLVVITVLQVVVLFLGRKFRLDDLSAKS
jgi:cytochrome b6